MYFTKDQQIATLYLQDIYIALAYIFHHQNIMKTLTISDETERYAKINECYHIISAIEEEIHERFKAITEHFDQKIINDYENPQDLNTILEVLEKYFTEEQMTLVEKVLNAGEAYTERKYEKRQQELEALRLSLISSLLDDELEDEAERLLTTTNSLLEKQRWMHSPSALNSDIYQAFRDAIEEETKKLAGTLIKQYSSMFKKWIENQIEYKQMIKARPFLVGFNALLNIIYKILDPTSSIPEEEKYRIVRQCLKHYAKEADCYGQTIAYDVLSDIEDAEKIVVDQDSLSRVLDIIYQARDRHNTQGLKTANYHQSIQITCFAAQLDQIRTETLIESDSPLYQAESHNYKILRLKTVYKDILTAGIQTGEDLAALGFPDEELEKLQNAYEQFNTAGEALKDAASIAYDKALSSYLDKALASLDSLQIDTDHIKPDAIPSILEQQSKKLLAFTDRLESLNKARQKVSSPSFLAYQLAAHKQASYRVMYGGLLITAGVFAWIYRDSLQSGLSSTCHSLSTIRYKMPSVSDAKGLATYAVGTLGAAVMKQTAEPVVSYTFSALKPPITSTSSQTAPHHSHHSARFYTSPIERREDDSGETSEPKSESRHSK